MRTEWIFLLLAASLNAGANLLLKFGDQQSPEDRISPYLSWTFFVALVLFGLNLLAYTQALRVMPLSIAYPLLVGLSTAGLAITSIWLFGDYVDSRKMLGYALLVGAIFLLSK